MDQELKEILQQIANELRERNEMTREATARTEERMHEIQAKRGLLEDGLLGDRLKTMQDKAEERLAKSQEEATERADFQKSLIAELRRINENLEALNAGRFPEGS